MTAGGTPGNVALGPGRLYVAAIGTTEPTSCSSTLPTADWYAVGYTEEGSSFKTETTSEEIMVAEELDPIKYENTKRMGELSFAMAETTRRNLILALNDGAGAAVSAASVEPPALGAEDRVMIVWDSDDSPSATNKRWLFRRCYQSGAIEIKRQKAPNKSLLEVTFRLELPTTAGVKPWIAFPNSSGLI